MPAQKEVCYYLEAAEGNLPLASSIRINLIVKANWGRDVIEQNLTFRVTFNTPQLISEFLIM